MTNRYNNAFKYGYFIWFSVVYPEPKSKTTSGKKTEIMKNKANECKIKDL
jgi:hypothetical protein